jgi:hypothetical protein
VHYAVHDGSTVCALGVLRHPKHGEHGLDDLLQDDGAEDLSARDAVAHRDLCQVVDAAAGEPGHGGEVEEVEGGGGEPVGGHRGKNSEERVGEEGGEGGRRGVVYGALVEEPVLLQLL